MIKYIKNGNLFESQCDIYVNTINTKGVMGKGIALEFKKRFPDMFSSYVGACQNELVKPGKLFIYFLTNNTIPKVIVNFATKDHWRNPSKYEWIESGLIQLKEFLQNKNYSMAMPALGCSNGQLEWNKVKILIENYLNGLNNTIEVYEPL